MLYRCIRAILVLGLLLGAQTFVLAVEEPLDEANKVWKFDSNTRTMMFVDPKRDYIRGNLKFSIDDKAVTKSFFPDGSLKSLRYYQDRSLVVLDFFPPVDRYPKRNVVASSRIFLNVGGLFVLHDYMRVFSRKSSLLLVAKWRQGVLDGEYKVYTTEGKLVEQRWYEGGYPIKTWKLMYPSGQLASEVTFPKNVEEWANTEDYLKNENLDFAKQDLINMPYRFPKEVTETWYSPKGYVSKKVYYHVFSSKGYFQVEPTGKEETWNAEGNIISSQSKFYGRTTKSTSASQYGTQYQTQKVWWGTKQYINKSWTYPSPLE